MKQSSSSSLFDAAWQNYIGQAQSRSQAAEIEHWKVATGQYDRTNSLAKDAPQLIERLLGVLSEMQAASVLEIGAGTGEFSLPVVGAGHYLTALDQSPDMLAVLTAKLHAANLSEFETVVALWEDYEPVPTRSWDVVLSVNSLYRVPDIRAALTKVNGLATKRAIFIRSIGGQPAPPPIFYHEFGSDRLKPVLPDHLYILGVLYELGVNANLAVYEVKRQRNYADFAAIERIVTNWFRTPPTPDEHRRLVEILREREMSEPVEQQGWVYRPTHHVAFIDWLPSTS
jgi:SAM-dependent methyltransferase